MTDRRAALRADILAAHGALLATVDTLHDDHWQQSSPNEGWTVKDTLAHLSSIEDRLRAMLRCALAGAAWVAEDVHSYNARKITERRAWTVAQLRAEAEQERDATLALLDTVREEDLDRPFEHPTRGRVTVERLWRIIPNHLRAHTQELATAPSRQ